MPAPCHLRVAQPLELVLRAQVPALLTPEGGLFESNAIARYVAKLADPALVGKTAYESVSVPLHALSSLQSALCRRARCHEHAQPSPALEWLFWGG